MPLDSGLILDGETMEIVDSIGDRAYNAFVARRDSQRRTIGSVLRELRELGGATLEEVAPYVDVHWATLSKIEKGERPYRDHLMPGYAKAVPEIATKHAADAILAALRVSVDIKDILARVDTLLKEDDGSEEPDDPATGQEQGEE